MSAALLGLVPLASEFRIDERMIAVLDAKSLGQSMGAVGQIEPFFGERQQMAFVRSIFGAACQFDRLRRVRSIIVFFGHGRGTEVRVSSRRTPASLPVTLSWQTGSEVANREQVACTGKLGHRREPCEKYIPQKRD